MPQQTVVVYFHPTEESEPTEYGRATLDTSGRAVVTGFSKELRDRYQTEGIYDAIGIAGPRGAMVRTGKGAAFLTVLLHDYSGTRYTAQRL